jgi:hypothetical protein
MKCVIVNLLNRLQASSIPLAAAFRVFINDRLNAGRFEGWHKKLIQSSLL